MRIVLTNDDGFAAPGLAALRRAVEGLAELVVVAPVAEWSSCGHRVTTGVAIPVERHGADFAVHGAPADCVRLALDALVPDAAWVIAGINPGGNLGADVHYSGTVAAAREAALHGRPALACSHYRRRGVPVDWERAAAWVRALLPELLATPPAPGRFLNLNLPHPDAGAERPPAVRCAVDPSPLPLRYRAEAGGYVYCGDYHLRQRRPGMDVETCLGGAISVSELGV